MTTPADDLDSVLAGFEAAIARRNKSSAVTPNGCAFEPAEPYPGIVPGGLAECALAALRRTRPPRNYAAENAYTLAARQRAEDERIARRDLYLAAILTPATDEKDQAS